MISNAFLIIAYNFILLLISPILAFDDVVLSSELTSALTTAKTYLANANQVFPVTTLTAILGIIFAIEVAILLWKGINWLIRKIPTIS